MAKFVRGAVLAVVAGFLFHAAPASAEIELKAGCDGKWVAKPGAGFETYMVCEHQAAQPRLSAMRLRAHKKIAHMRPHRAVPVHVAARETPLPVQFVSAPVPPRRDTECLTLLCPQFVLVGVGY